MENIAIISGGKANTTGHNASMPSPSIGSHDEEESGKSGSDQNSADDNAPPVPYRDYSRECKEESSKARRSGKTTQTFPMILHEILSHPEFEDIISWLPHGRAWRIVRHKAFEERVIPLFFRHGRYSSFARQVNGWGFRRITHGTDYNAYYHEMFLRGLPHICNKMRRLTSKDEDRVKNEDAPTPDFYSLSRANPLPSDSKTPAKQTLAAAPVLPSSVGPVLGIAAPPFSRGTKALADMSLADLENERTEILRQMHMRVGAAAPASGVLAAQLGRQDLAQASGNVHSGAYTQAPGASTPYAISSGAGAPGLGPGPAWNAPTSSMTPAPTETGGISQAALYQALISQLTSASGNQAAPAPLPPPPPPPPAASSNQSILEALLGGNGGGLMQLLNAGGGSGSGGPDASTTNPALRNLQMQLGAGAGGGGPDASTTNPGALRNLQMQLGAGAGGGGPDASSTNPALRNLQMQLGAGAGGGGPDANPGALRSLQMQLGAGGGGVTDANNGNPGLRSLQMQLQQATGAPQGGNDNGANNAAMPGIQRQPQPPFIQQQGRSVDPASNMQLHHGVADNAPASDLMRQYQQAMSSQQQRSSSGVGGGSEGDIMASIQRQIQQAQANQQRGGGEDDFTATIQRQIQQAQANQQRGGGGGGEDDFTATIQRQIQQAQAKQQRGGGEDDLTATIQRQIQQAQAKQQHHQLRQQDDSNEVSGIPQQVAAPVPSSQQSGSGRDAMANLQTQLQHSDPATRLQLQMLAGRLGGGQANNNSSSNGTPDIAALAAIMGLPGFPKPNESGNN